MGQTPPKYFLPSAPAGASEGANALNPTQPAAQNPQTPLLPPNFTDPGTQNKAGAPGVAATGVPAQAGPQGKPDWQNFYRRGMFLLLLSLVLPVLSLATTTVTGHITDLSGAAATSGTFARFNLRGCAGNQPRVLGTAIIAPTNGATWYKDFPADGSGNITGTIYSTRDVTGVLGGDITCGTSTTGVWYGLVIYVSGKAGPEIAIHAKNTATLDVTSVTPITVNPVITAPTGDSTYCRLDSGNGLCPGVAAISATNLVGPGTVTGNYTHSGTETFSNAVNSTGTFTCTNFETTRCVDVNNVAGWAGADVCAWILSAYANLPATGGNIVVADGVYPPCASGFAFAGGTKRLNIYMRSVTITVSNTFSFACSSGQCHVYGVPFGVTVIQQSATFPANTPTIQIGATGETGMTVEGVQAICNASVANSIGFETLAQDYSGPRQATASNCTKYGFWHEGGNANNSLCIDCWALTKGATANGHYIHNVNRYTGININSMANAGVSDPVTSQIVWDGSTGAIFTCHVEDTTNGVDNGSVTASDLEVHNCSGGPGVTNVIRNEATTGNRLSAFNINSNGSTNSVLDSRNTITRTDSWLPRYQAFGPNGNTVLIEDDLNGRLLLHLGTNQNLRIESLSSTPTIESVNDASSSDVPLILSTTAVTPSTAGGGDVGSTALPWANLWLATAGSIKFNSNLLVSGAAPTISAAGCGGAAASIPSNNGTASFTVNVGTTPTAGGCTITMPAATTAWSCFVNDITTNSTSVFYQKQTGAVSTTSVILQNFSDVAVATAPTAGDIYRVSCYAY